MTEQAQYKRIGAQETRSMESVLIELLNSPKPAQSIAKVIQDGKSTGASVFEQYASSVLERAGGLQLMAERRSDALKLIAPENGRLAQIVHAGGFPPSLEPALLATECALNRLICLSDAISDGRSENEARDVTLRRSISILGGGYLSTNAGWRSARVILPEHSVSERISQRFYNEVDWRTTDCVASNARAIFQRSLRPNAYRTTLGVSVASQSDWDVRTRLAQIFGALELPHRYSFRFDYDGDRREVSVAFTCPPLAFLPELLLDDESQRKSDARARAYQVYLLRLACLFSAACFGGGRTIEFANVVGYDASWETPLVRLAVKRDEFVRSVLVRIDADEFSLPQHRFNPQAIADMIDAPDLDWLGRDGGANASGILVPDDDDPAVKVAPGLDERLLDNEGRALFHCMRICDVDTSMYVGGNSEAVDLARTDSMNSPLAAILRLESLVAEIEESLSAPLDDASARPLYAPDPLSRLAIVLLDDELTVADQAQAYLQGDLEALPADKAHPRFFKVPSALYHAHLGLSCLYQELGNFSNAQLHADRCIALAPTTASAYYRKADVLAEQGYLVQAANVLMIGLRYCAVSADCALLYFNLGMLLANVGESEKSAAVHAYCLSLDGVYSEKSKHVIEVIRTQSEAPDSAFAKPFAASRLLLQMRIPLAPIDLRSYIAPATISLANSGSSEAAAPYASMLERNCRNDEVIISACRSIQYGIK